MALVFILTLPSMHNVFAETDYVDYFDKGIDWLKGFSQGSLNNTDIDPTTKDKINEAIEGGVPVAKKGIDFWLSVHEWIVHEILSNSPISLGVGIATLISIGLVGFAIFHFIKKIGKFVVIVALIVIGIVLFITIFGIQW
jgi:hypothetical protein